uniref:Uncharacterized protein n=1 Tax=Arundo donax TaxID=35708 RepID=A0A0A8Z583_ARUDO
MDVTADAQSYSSQLNAFREHSAIRQNVFR